MNTNSVLDEERDREVFESVTGEEILYLWRSVKGRSISDTEIISDWRHSYGA